MDQAANVRSIDALRDFKAGLIEFGQDAGLALTEATTDVQRAISWLQHEQPAHWQRELKKRHKKLAEAKSVVVQKETQQVSTVLERRAVAAAQRSVEEAEEKIRLTKKWSRELERELLIFRGECQQLARVVEGDIPRTVARIERMVEHLEAYVGLSAPSLRGIVGVGGAPEESPTALSRGEDAEPPAPADEEKDGS